MSYMYRVNVKCPVDRPALPPHCFGLKSDRSKPPATVIVCEPVHSKQEIAFLNGHGVQPSR